MIQTGQGTDLKRIKKEIGNEAKPYIKSSHVWSHQPTWSQSKWKKTKVEGRYFVVKDDPKP